MGGATKDILSRAYGDAITSVESSNRVYAASYNNDSISRQEIHTNKTITLKIEGGNSITVDVNGFKDQFVDMLSENLRPVLVNIIEEDIFEEGEGSYIF